MTWEDVEKVLKASPGKFAYRTTDPRSHRWLLRWGGPGEPKFWWRNPHSGSEHAFAVTENDKSDTWVMA